MVLFMLMVISCKTTKSFFFIVKKTEFKFQNNQQINNVLFI